MSGSLLDEILTSIEALPEDQKAALIKTAMEETASRWWIPNPGPQTDAVECEADELFYGGQAGGGKLSDINELVLTPTGWKRIGDLKVGSKICAVDGTVTEVIGVFPQGIKPNYRVYFHDGTSCLAGLEHNWLGWWTGKATKRANTQTFGRASAAKWTTAEIIAGMEREEANQRVKRFAIPICDPVAFNVPGCPRRTNGGTYVRREIDPYLLGLLLGDGSMSVETTISLTSADQEIIDLVLKSYPGDVSISAKPDNKAFNLRFRGATLKWLRQKISGAELGLAGHKAETKFIPFIYLFGTVDERWALLQGLMDTDGWADDDGDCYFCTISEQLRDDVAHLARSLGAIVTITEKAPTYSYDGERRQGQPAFALRIKVPDSTKLFRLTRKLARCGREPQTMAKYVDRIEYSHDAESVCIAVRHASSLYITRDFIVTHNTDLICGLALTDHHNSLLLRRTKADVIGIEDRLAEILDTRDGLNSQKHIWRLPDRIIEIGGVQYENDKQAYKGRPHDLKAFDEIADFSEGQYRFIIAWNRSTRPGQRCRVVCTGNPPTTPEGLWVLRYWGAWLDPTHPNPAKEGELRWYTTIDGADVECPGPEPVEVNGELIQPKSRSFIRSKLSDNPDLAATNYDATLAALPAELRDAYRQGKFDAVQADKPSQVLPTAWVKAAMDRWSPEGVNQYPMTVLSNDVALGGGDKNAIARRHGTWFDEIIAKKLPKNVDPIEIATELVQLMRDGCDVVIDMGGGYGSGVYSHLNNNVQGIKLHRHNGADASGKRTRDGKLKFKNKRAEVHWMLREALEPGLGVPIALPPDPELLADLTALTYKLTPSGIQVISKEDLKKQLGRSPDKGDCVVNAWNYGEMPSDAVLRTAIARQRMSDGTRFKVNLGHAGRKQGRRR